MRPRGQISTGANGLPQSSRSTARCPWREPTTRPSLNGMKRHRKSLSGSVRGHRSDRRLTDMTGVEFLGHLINAMNQRAPAVTGNRKSKPGGNPCVVASSQGWEGGRQGPRTSRWGQLPREDRSEQGGSWPRCCAWAAGSSISVDVAWQLARFTGRKGHGSDCDRSKWRGAHRGQAVGGGEVDQRAGLRCGAAQGKVQEPRGETKARKWAGREGAARAAAGRR